MRTNCRVVYDVTADWLGFSESFVCIVFVVIFVFTARRIWRAKLERTPIAAMVLWLVVWSLGAGGGAVNVVYQHYRCIHLASSGQFDVVEGVVSSFRPLEANQKGSEQFTVNNQTFSYSDRNLSGGGMRQTFGRTGPMADGVYVRVAHHSGTILKLEFCDP